jgi:hypothetical protein
MSALLDLLFWGVLASYVVHIIDETVLGVIGRRQPCSQGITETDCGSA